MTSYNQSVIEKIDKLKRKHNAIILAHNYQRPEIQDIADFVGDSFELSLNASKSDASIIIFCGVHFMAETAALLCPNKKVLLPNINAGCNMADMITAEQLREKKNQHPRAGVVCYINTSAEVKAECDICCTSANAVKIVNSLPQEEIIFVPDQYLGNFVATKVSKKLHLWHGYCPTHMRILPEHIDQKRSEYPEAIIVVHPECTPQVIAKADFVLGTGGMIKLAKSEEVKTMVVGTEIGILHRLNKENPGKNFVALTNKAVCPNMKITTLEQVLWCLEDLVPEVTVDEKIRSKAKITVEKMIEASRNA